MEGPSIVLIVSIIVVILNVILFFKIWGMCDNVKRLTDRFCEGKVNLNTNTTREWNGVKVQAILKAAPKDDVVTEDLIGELSKIVEKADGKDEEDYKREYGVTTEEDIAAVLKEYKKLYTSMGEKLPSELAKIKTLEDLWALFE